MHKSTQCNRKQVQICTNCIYIYTETAADDHVSTGAIDKISTCYSRWCFISTVHSVHYYTDVPLPPIMENVTVGTTWINLTWDHNESCCRNGKYELSWQQWQSKEASDDMNSSNILNPDRHPSITPLKPGTMYIVTLSVECQMYELQNATISVNTSIGKCIIIYIYNKYTCSANCTCTRFYLVLLLMMYV